MWGNAGEQGSVFLFMLGAGVATGMLYQLMTGVRRLMRAGKILTALCDLLFTMGAAGIWFAALYFAAWGEVRIYALAAAGIGCALYCLCVAGIRKIIINKPKSVEKKR